VIGDTQERQSREDEGKIGTATDLYRGIAPLRPERGDQDCLWDDQGDSNVHGDQVRRRDRGTRPSGDLE